MSSAGPSERAVGPHDRPVDPRAIVFVAVLAAFTANVDLSIVNLALPVIGRAFDVGQSELAWTVNAYVLPYAVSILAVGRLADGFGHRRVLAIGAMLFLAGSLIAAAAPGYPVLLAGRAVQGLGGSALLTIGMAIISANFSGPERGRALGLYFAAGASAAVVGPLLGGWLASIAGWQAIFWSQVPLAALVALTAVVLLPATSPGARRSLDVPGLVLGSVVLLAINGALLQADGWGWTSPAILGLWIAAVAALVAFVARERGAAEPAVRLSVFRSRVFVASALVGAAAWFGILSGSVQLAIYLQTLRGLDATGAALVLLPWPLVAGLLFPRSGAIVARLGTERVMIGSLMIAAVAAALMIGFGRTTPLPMVSLVAALGGVPIALGVTASTIRALAEFAAAEAGIASAVFNSLRQVGSSLGVAIPAAVFDAAAAGGAGASAAAAEAGSSAAFASRAIVFVICLVLVAMILPRAAARASPVVAPA
jgi:EmrB/QacA subfamily drug resistance transporter